MCNYPLSTRLCKQEFRKYQRKKHPLELREEAFPSPFQISTPAWVSTLSLLGYIEVLHRPDANEDREETAPEDIECSTYVGTRNNGCGLSGECAICGKYRG